MKRGCPSGMKHHLFGKHRSQEVKEKISKSMTGVKRSKLTKLRMSYAKKGIKFSEEWKKNLSKFWNSPKGRGILKSRKAPIFSEEFRHKLREARKNRKIPFRDTKPERLTAYFLQSINISFEKHKLFNLNSSYHRVDIFIRPNICIEVDGCYFHYCKICNINKIPTQTQIATVQRDKFIDISLVKMKYLIVRLSEHDINKGNFNILIWVLDQYVPIPINFLYYF